MTYGRPTRRYDELLHVPPVVANGPKFLEVATDNLVSIFDVPLLSHNSLGLEVLEMYEGGVPGVDQPRNLVMAEHEVKVDFIVGGRSQDWLCEGDEVRDDHRLVDHRNGFVWAEIDDHSEESRADSAVENDILTKLEVEPRRF